MMKNVSLKVCGAACLLLAVPSQAQPLLSLKSLALFNAEAGTVVAVSAGDTKRSIVSVETITVESPAGTVPRLPFQVWVTYSDGTSEYRQVRWSNSALATEKEQADEHLYPVGKSYRIDGFIVGDNTTANGYPVSADVKVVAGAYRVPSNKPVAETLPLDKVTINGNNRLTSNRELDIDAILSWDVSQQLYNYRDTYGLSTEGYKEADGWDSPTTKLKGHGSGHYMSALAFAFASATKKEQKDALRKNITRMVNELRECQERTFVWNEQLGRYWEARDFAPEDELRDMKGTWEAFDEHKKDYAKYGYGYLNAIPAHHAALIEMYRGYNNENWVWAPYYSIHKQLAGLIDIATYIDDKKVAAKALLIAKDMGLWIWNRMHYRTFVETGGTQEERRAKPGNRYEMWNMYIAGEDGGTGESLSRLSEMVSDPTEKARLLEAASCFDSPAFYEPLSRNIDDVRTRHANQHIPKITSALRSYRGNKNPYYYNLALNFWNMIQGRYSYATGGVGNGEMFRQPYTQILSMNTNLMSDRNRNLSPNPTINETCCAYNLAKLTKDLNCFDPDDARYMDYYERVLYNQIIGSVHPTHYMTTYQYAVGLNASKPWGNETPQSTCCGGTGSENHVKYQEATYFVSDNTIWVGLYMPTTLTWDAKKVKIQQDCLWPAEQSTIKIIEGKGTFAMKLRVPYWATSGFDVKLNGVSVAKEYKPSSYVEIPSRKWKKGDVVEVTMPFTKHINYGPDKMETAATGLNQTNTAFEPMWVGTIMYGPLAMATDHIDNWEQATVNIDAALDCVKLNAPTKEEGTNGNIYTLSLGDRTFVPDYYLGDNSTHYLRINLIDDPSEMYKGMLLDKIEDAKIFMAGNYTPDSYSALKNEITAAEKLCEEADIKEEQMNARMSAIARAIDNLVATGLDKSALEKAVKEAEANKADQFTWDSYADLQTVLNEAKRVCETGTSQILFDRQRLEIRHAVAALLSADKVDKTKLRELLKVVEERKAAQEAWIALEVKVPEYSPWAPYGYVRLMEQFEKVKVVNENRDKNYNQEEVNNATSSLNAAINTMRPGNLPELEDMNDLLKLLKEAREASVADKQALKEAVEYSEMVVRYVGDGSGTMDMIVKACDRLKAVLGK